MEVMINKKPENERLKVLLTSTAQVKCEYCEDYRRLGICENPYFCTYYKTTEDKNCVSSYDILV